MNRFLLLLFVCLLTVPAFAAVVYEVPAGAGFQTWTGSLAMPFQVLNPVLVTGLGAFDDNTTPGLTNPISVGIYDAGTQLVFGGLQTSVTGTGEYSAGGARFNSVAPTMLPVGNYFIVAWGFGAADPNGNVGTGSPAYTLNNLGGSLDFNGLPLYGNPGQTGFPGNLDGGPSNRYWAGTFDAEAIPEPTTLVLFGAGLAALGLLRKKRA